MVKNLPAIAGGASSIPGSGRFPGEGNGNPLQYFCLGSSMYKRARWATVHGVTKESNVTKHAIARPIILFLNVVDLACADQTDVQATRAMWFAVCYYTQGAPLAPLFPILSAPPLSLDPT